MYPSIPPAWKQHDASIKPYVWAHRIVWIYESIFSLFVLGWFLGKQQFSTLEAWLEFSIDSSFFLWLAFFGTLAVGWGVMSFPFSVVGFWIEKRFKLSRQSPKAWFWDKVKGSLVGAVLGTVMLGLLYFAQTFEWWWLIASLLLILFSIVMAQLFPILLIPIFYKMKPLPDEALRGRLLEMAKRFGVEVSEVFSLGLGEKTEKGNAAFVGLGRTKRIIIGDTLYQKFSSDEVQAVFAHELGHQVHNDLWRGIALSSGLIILTFWLSNLICESWVFSYFETAAHRPFGLLLFFLVLSILQIPLGVLQAFFSRTREVKADEFAKVKIGSGAFLANALERLTIQNKGLFCPHPFVEWWTYSHPAPWRRITGLRGGTDAPTVEPIF